MSVVKGIIAGFLVVTAVAFTILAGLSLFTKSYAATSGTDKFELFRDLLVVLLALAALVGAAIYHLVREYVKNEVLAEAKKEIAEMTESVAREISREKGKSLILTGFGYYEEGRLDRAIMATRAALEALRQQPPDDANVLMAKNNLAYYLASEYKKTAVPQHLDEASRLAEEVYKKYDPLRDDHSHPIWVETWVFAKTLTVTKTDAKSLEEQIQTLIARSDLQSIAAELKKHLQTIKAFMAGADQEGSHSSNSP